MRLTLPVQFVHSKLCDEDGGSSFIIRSELFSGDPAGVADSSESALDPVDFACGGGVVLPPDSPSFPWSPLYVCGERCPLLLITVS